MSANQYNFLAALVGFVIANAIFLVFSGKFEGDKIENSIFLNIASYQIHIHHWMIGLVSLIILLILEQFVSRHWLISFLKGGAMGAIFHGLVFYNDYFDVVKFKADLT